MGYSFLAINAEPYTVPLHGLEVWPSRNEGDVLSGECELNAQVSTDRAGPVDANFHKIR